MLDLVEFVKNNYSKNDALALAEYIHQNPHRLPDLIALIKKEEEPISRRCAWYFSTLFDKHPQLVYPLTDELIASVDKIKSQAILRSFLRTISRMYIPPNYHAFLIQFSSELILSNKSEIAVKAMAMDIFFYIAKLQPELFFELEYMLDFIYPEGSKGIQNKCRKMSRYIDKYRTTGKI